MKGGVRYLSGSLKRARAEARHRAAQKRNPKSNKSKPAPKIKTAPQKIFDHLTPPPPMTDEEWNTFKDFGGLNKRDGEKGALLYFCEGSSDLEEEGKVEVKKKPEDLNWSFSWAKELDTYPGRKGNGSERKRQGIEEKRPWFLEWDEKGNYNPLVPSTFESDYLPVLSSQREDEQKSSQIKRTRYNQNNEEEEQRRLTSVSTHSFTRFGDRHQSRDTVPPLQPSFGSPIHTRPSLQTRHPSRGLNEQGRPPGPLFWDPGTHSDHSSRESAWRRSYNPIPHVEPNTKEGEQVFQQEDKEERMGGRRHSDFKRSSLFDRHRHQNRHRPEEDSYSNAD